MPSTTEKQPSKPVSAKLVGRPSSRHESTLDPAGTVPQNQSILKKHDTLPTSQNKDSHSMLRQSTDRKNSASLSGTKPESKLSLKMMMSPPLIVFGGQNAVRLDPLLTRKSTASSGR